MTEGQQFDTDVLFLKTFTCPVCKRVIKNPQIKKNATRAVKREDDLSATYTKLNPSHYGVVICTHCGYAAFSQDFENLGERAKRGVIEHISANWKPRVYSSQYSLNEVIEIHSIALFNYEVQKRKASDIGRLAQRLAWFYREAGDTERSERFERECLELYKRAYIEENLDVNPDLRTTIYYLIGYYSLKFKDYNEAVKMFREAIISNRSGRAMHIERLAEDKLAQAKQAYREENGEHQDK